MSIMVGTGRGATAGVLVKSAEALEILEKVDTLVIDKTGTLTEGKPRVLTVDAADGVEESAVLRLAASLEVSSEHPLAAAILKAARDRGVEPSPVRDFRYLPGKGISGQVEGRVVALGNAAMMSRMEVPVDTLTAHVEGLRREGQTVVYLATEGRVIGLLGIADPLKASTKEALAVLHSEGIRIVMLTGDSRTTAEAVARQLSLDEVIAEVLPQAKGAAIRKLRQAGRIVAMAGDGINDAPSLAEAHVGIAMGTGTDVAIQTAGITLVKGDLRGLVRARRLSRATMSNIRQNLFFAFCYNALGIPIAAGALYPFFGVLLSPMIASAAMTFSSVSVIGNALRLRKVPL
jgi:Cu+-exporting ATPase